MTRLAGFGAAPAAPPKPGGDPSPGTTGHCGAFHPACRCLTSPQSRVVERRPVPAVHAPPSCPPRLEGNRLVMNACAPGFTGCAIAGSGTARSSGGPMITASSGWAKCSAARRAEPRDGRSPSRRPWNASAATSYLRGCCTSTPGRPHRETSGLSEQIDPVQGRAGPNLRRLPRVKRPRLLAKLMSSAA
jgi:hypothetical protein